MAHAIDHEVVDPNSPRRAHWRAVLGHARSVRGPRPARRSDGTTFFRLMRSSTFMAGSLTPSSRLGATAARRNNQVPAGGT